MVDLISAQGLTKHYGDKLALDHASFTIEEGQVVGLLGLNGAGKTTTMNILTGYLSATSGTAAIGGYDIALHPQKAKRITGYLPEQPAFYPEMKVREHLDFICGLKGIDSGREKHIADICNQVGLSHMQGRMIRNLSKGYRQRLGFAQALVGNPRVIILDEPTVGLDPSQIIEIRQLIQELGKRSTVIVSSHILTEIQAVCGRVIMLKKGRIIADRKMEEMVGALSAGSRLRVRIQGEKQETLSALKAMPELHHAEALAQCEPGACDFLLKSTSGMDIRAALFQAMAAANLPLLEMHSGNLSLEEAFLSLETGAAGEGGAV